MMDRHALVVGGGIAGPLAALALRRVGASVTVYEAHPEGAAFAAGAWLTVAVNGLRAMRALGVYELVISLGFPTEIIELASGTGKRLGSVPIGGTLADGTVTHTLKRADLCRALCTAAAERGVRFEYGKRLRAIVQTDRQVIAEMEDGSEARGDFLIGADGVHSRVRQLLDPHAAAARFTGLGNIGGFAPACGSSEPELALPPRTMRMIFGKRAFFGYTNAPDGSVFWFANPAQPRELTRHALATTDWRAQVLEAFADDHGPMLALIARTPGTLTNANQYDLARVRRWHQGRVLLLGDAAHAATPSSGQGVSMAAEDAVALEQCMRDHPLIEAAFAAFVRARRPRAERVVAYGRRYGNLKVAGPIGRRLRDALFPLVLRSQARNAGASLAWLFETGTSRTSPTRSSWQR